MRLRTVLALLSLLLLSCPLAVADEGMWTFDNIPKKAIQEKHGVTITDAWLDKVRLSSVRLGDGGCSASFVSPDGLILTNHHCVRDCLDQLSSARNDIAAGGFLARTLEEEIRCEGASANVLVGTEEITSKIVSAAKGLPDKEANEARKREMTRLEKECEEASKKGKERLYCEAVTLYQGGQYFLYKYRRYDDVRMVFAPENAIADFGGDPDNFNFPRYDLDMALLRAYENGRPVRPERHLRMKAAGPPAGEPVFVSGHPGSTERTLTVAELRTLRDVIQPLRLLRGEELRGRLIQFSKTGPEPYRIAANSLSGIENSIKVYKGELAALLDETLLDRKMAEEKELRARVASDPSSRAANGSAWDEIARAEKIHRAIHVRHAFLEDGTAFTSDLFDYARSLVRAAAERRKPDAERLREYRESALPQVERDVLANLPIYPDLEELKLSFSLDKMREWLGPDDPLVKQILGKETPDDVAHALVSGTKLADAALRKRLWDGGQKAIEESADPMIRFALLVDPESRAIRKRFEDEVEAPVSAAHEKIARALFAAKGTSIYPDATGTLRLSDGVVKGWIENGREVPPFTTIGGAFERATGRPPFDLPPRWIQAKPRLKMDTPLNFVSTNDIAGGNSGSPLIDRDGFHVGLAFDGNIHSLAGAYWFDPSVNRTVAVHPAAILEALRAVYGAERLARELEGAQEDP
jgi:hypothetical protein